MTASTPSPRILLAGLDPIFGVGMARALAEAGAEIVDAGSSDAASLVRAAIETQPRAIILGDDSAVAQQTGDRLRIAAPGAVLVLWRHDADNVGVLGPGDRRLRHVAAPAPEALCRELFRRDPFKGETCRPT